MLFDGLVDQGGIALAGHGFHHLADEETEEFIFPGFVFRDFVGVGGEDRGDGGVDGGAVGDLAQALGFHDGSRRLSGFDHLLKHVFGDAAVDGFVGDEVQQFAQGGGGDGRVFDGPPRAVHGGEEIAGHPVGGQARVPALRDGFVEIGGGLVGDENAGVVEGDAILFAEAAAFFIRQFRQFGFERGDPGFIKDQGKQIGLGEIAVVMRVFL